MTKTTNTVENKAITGFTCTKCGDCCKNINTKDRVFMLFPADIPKLEKGLGISREKLISNYVEKSTIPTKAGNAIEVYYVKPADNGNCPFLQDDNLCGVQENKPEQCIRTPYNIAWHGVASKIYDCMKDVDIPENYSTTESDKELFETLQDGYDIN